MPTKIQKTDAEWQQELTPLQYDILRRKGTPYDELGLGDITRSDDSLIDAILAHPILLERPVVVTQRGVRLCRPPETVGELIGQDIQPGHPAA